MDGPSLSAEQIADGWIIDSRGVAGHPSRCTLNPADKSRVLCGPQPTMAEFAANVMSERNVFGPGAVARIEYDNSITLRPVTDYLPCPDGYEHQRFDGTGPCVPKKQRPTFLKALGQAAATFVTEAASFAANPALYAVKTNLEAQAKYNDALPMEARMSFNVGSFLSGVSGIFGSSGIPGANFLQAGAQIASAFAPQPAAMPMPMPSYPTMQAQPVGAFAVPAAAAAAMAGRLAPVLTKMAVKLGLRAKPSLQRAMEIVRRAAKILGSPTAVAAALGITTAELAELITAQAARRRRRMNPANSRALRRAVSRVKSFHKLCQHTDVLKSRGRRSSCAPVYNFQRRKKCA